MSALDDLKDRIDSAIYTNTEQNITGDGLQTVLDDMVDTMGVSVSQNTLTTDNKAKAISVGGTDYNITDQDAQEKISQLGQYIDNPEWVRVVTDRNDKILYGLKTDGKFYFGDGCPPQVQEYVLAQIDSIGIDALLATKVDKVTGKSLIDADFADSQEAIENPEWMQVATDSGGRVLGGRDKDGKIREYVGMEVDNISARSSKITEELILNDGAKSKLLSELHPCRGKKISVIGDSISTCFRNYGVYWKVLQVDIGHEIQSYITLWDVFQDSDATIPTNKTIGGVALTREMIGTLQTFTPIAEDVGKELGTPVNYNGRDTIVWSEVLCESVGATLLSSASWSGSRICKGQEQLRYVLSEAWSDYTIGCLKRRDNDGNDIIPDVVIIYRGTNDMTHEPYTRLSDIDLMNGVPNTDYINSQYEFKAGYYLTIKKIRETYPKAIIVCCTLNNFKRINYSHFPVNNGINTLPDYNNAIREIANTMGCDLIEFDKDGITYENMYSEGYITDSATTPTHPNNKGHKVMAERAITDLRNISFN